MYVIVNTHIMEKDGRVWYKGYQLNHEFETIQKIG